MHNHTSKHSSCSMISPDTLINAYIDAGIDGICITEHDYLWKEEERSELLQKYEGRINIFFGTEVSTDVGHVLLFGANIKKKGYVTYIDDLINRLDRKTTALVWAHPYRWGLPRGLVVDQELIDKFDAIELLNGNLDKEMISYTENKLSNFRTNLTGGSDTHSSGMAINYATKFENSFTTLKGFVENIKNGRYKPIRL